MQPTSGICCSNHMVFQSSSGQKAGCNLHGSASCGRIPTGFNPHPARRPDATGDLYLRMADRGVSILIRPEGRMQRLLVGGGIALCAGSFNPHPARRPDATSRKLALTNSTGCSCFNPHPARRPDATVDLIKTIPPRFHVSILIRPEGRMQLTLNIMWDSSPLFQSSSGQKAGCNPIVGRMSRCSWLFQSSSGQKAGCNPAAARRHLRRNPVSILIRPEGRMQLWLVLTRERYQETVSILIRPEGRMQPKCDVKGRGAR